MIQVFRKRDRRFEAYGGPPGVAAVSRLVGPELSSTMGAGIATFDDCSVEWTVKYDELIVVLEGLFRLRTGERVYECDPGDVLWLPEGTELRYEGQKAAIFYAVYPVDWRQRAG